MLVACKWYTILILCCKRPLLGMSALGVCVLFVWMIYHSCFTILLYNSYLKSLAAFGSYLLGVTKGKPNVGDEQFLCGFCRSPDMTTAKTIKWAYSTRPIYGWGDIDQNQRATAGWLAALPVFEPHWQVCMAGGLSSGTCFVSV